MNEDCLKLTAYFAERQRLDGRYLADALLDLFGGRRLATSILLRGIAGFGQRHQLRSDLSLTMAEDPPIVAIAVDSRQRIEGMLLDVLAVNRSGLLTLERARLMQDEFGPVTLPEELNDATKLSVYVGRHERIDGAPAFVAVCDLLHRRGIAGASVFVGVDGTLHGQREKARFFDRNLGVPTMIVAVGSGARIATVLPELGALLSRPLCTLERVRICKRDGILLERPHRLPSRDEHGMPLWQKLTVYTGESDLVKGEPIHRALVRRLRQSPRASGATAVRGVWGFHGDHRPHGDRFFQLGRRVPVSTLVVDTPSHIAELFGIVDELTTDHGLVTTEMVPAMTALDRDTGRPGLPLARFKF